MFEIVAFHTLDGGRLPVIAGLGLPTFLLLSAAFSVVSADRRGPAFVAGLKLRKLGLAWLFWCAVYAVVLSALAVRHGAPWYAPFHTPWMLLYGPRIHLWFIPAAGSISAYLHAATRHLDRHVISLLWLGIGGC